MPLFNPALDCGCCRASGSGSGSSGESGSSGVSGQSSGIPSGESSGVLSGESGSGSGSSGSGSGPNVCFNKFSRMARSGNINQVYQIRVCCVNGELVNQGSEFYSHDAGCSNIIPGGECCPDMVDTLILTFTSTECPCYDDVTITLTATAPNDYSGSAIICGYTVNFRFYCYSSPSWALEGTGGASFSGTNEPVTCSPFVWNSSSSVFISGLCEGSIVSANITE